MKKIFCGLLILLFSLSFYPLYASADGMVIKPDPLNNRWDYSAESNQQIFINHENGVEKMIISIGLKDEDSNTLWLFPVPAEPEKTVIDVLGNSPKLTGEEVTKTAKSEVNQAKNFLQMTQIYTIPFVISSNESTMSTFEGDMPTLGTAGSSKDIQQDVTVYEHLEKEGVTSEIITAKTANGLYDYFKNKGLKIKSGSIPVLDQYIGKNYSFVASWLESTTKNVLGITLPESLKQTDNKTLTENQKGILVTFPTKEIYVPLLPTSVYGSETVPMTIRIMGFVTPKLFQDIKNYTTTEYYINGFMDRYSNIPSDLENFYNGQKEDVKYTKMVINAPSKYLTNDLWITNHSPVKTYWSTFVALHPIAVTIILFLLCSIVSGIIIGWLIFKDLRKNIFKLALLGLSHCLSILGVWIVTLLINTKPQSNISSILAELKQKGYLWKRKLAAILIIADLPFLLISVFIIIDAINSSYLDATTLGAILIPVAILILVLFLKRIRKEDKLLFMQLKADHYSSWSFQPKDSLKYAFVPLFSISFLMIVWLAVKIIELTV